MATPPGLRAQSSNGFGRPITASWSSFRGARLVDCTIFQRPVRESSGGVSYCGNVCSFHTLQVDPRNSVQIRAAQVGVVERGAGEICADKTGGFEIGVAQIGFDTLCAAQCGAAQVGGVEIGEGEVDAAKIAVAQVCGTEVGAQQAGVFQIEPLQKGRRNIDADQRNSVCIQLLQSLDSAPAAALALGGVDDLPSLVVALLDAVAGLGEVEDDRDQHGEAPHVFEHFEQCPVAEREGYPLQSPLESDERDEPGMGRALPPHPPRYGPRSWAVHDHLLDPFSEWENSALPEFVKWLTLQSDGSRRQGLQARKCGARSKRSANGKRRSWLAPPLAAHVAAWFCSCLVISFRRRRHGLPAVHRRHVLHRHREELPRVVRWRGELLCALWWYAS